MNAIEFSQLARRVVWLTTLESKLAGLGETGNVDHEQAVLPLEIFPTGAFVAEPCTKTFSPVANLTSLNGGKVKGSRVCS